MNGVIPATTPSGSLVIVQSIPGATLDESPFKTFGKLIAYSITSTPLSILPLASAIVFPLSSKGENVIAEGKFSKLVLSEKQAKDWKLHLAAEKGIKLDTAKVVLNEADYYKKIKVK